MCELCKFLSKYCNTIYFVYSELCFDVDCISQIVTLARKLKLNLVVKQYELLIETDPCFINKSQYKRTAEI